MIVASCLRRKAYRLIKLYVRRYTTLPKKTFSSSFGLEEEDLQISIQGLYTKTNGVNELQDKSEDRMQMYENMLKNVPLHPDHSLIGEIAADNEVEKVRTTRFGVIRLDSDNPAKAIASREALFRSEEEKNLSQMPDIQRVGNSVEMPAILRKGKVQPDNIRKEKEIQEPGYRQNVVARSVPLVYTMSPYRDLTHLDVWNMLRKQVILENEFLLAINKPPGLPLHSPSIDCHHTVVDFFPEFARLANCQKIFPLHRLDKETTGVLLLAKTEKAAIVIREKFAKRQVLKKYLTITKNQPDLSQGSIEIPITEGKIQNTSSKYVFRAMLKPDLSSYKMPAAETPGKQAITHFKVIRSRQDCAFLEVNLETGIKHQIRVHLGMGLGCPVLGDHKYSHRDKLAPQRLSPSCLKDLKVDQSDVRHLPLHLHCSNIKLAMPEGFGKESNIFVHCRPPNYFMRSLQALKLR